MHRMTLEHGCWKCCDRCNYDVHTCGGCGEPLQHGQSACETCEREIREGLR